MIRFLKALRCALEGIGYGVTTQRHLRFHLIAGSLALIVGTFKGLAIVEWMVLVLLIAAVIAAELFNTALEAVVDLVAPEYHPLAKAAKDAAAGAVLTLAFAALVIGGLLFCRS
ncbi:diacylglycerol kinase family protein [Trichlorobacter ammonificans]|uniref:Undecaprenol kinase n=1 Tax=Trichlorobacter ammonificans TaxID=2916410 RepID=A0ABM9DD80_9BACT|nr:diacylglycerol kinase family protein [Trichlorobacter ammonificans]CAH2032325.1 Undecaprenol kinase [Trichlorobacter ammonificans]